MEMRKNLFNMPFCAIAIILIALSGACRSEDNKDYYMCIHYDVNDITSVSLRKGSELNAVPLKLNNGIADVRIPEMHVRGIGQITVIFKSKKHGYIEYVDGPVSAGRFLYVNCYDGRIVIQVVNTGYL